jgi:hypothetical protein
VDQPELFIVLDEFDLHARRDESTAVIAQRDERGWRNALATVFEQGIEQRVWSIDLDVDASVELMIATLKGIRLRSGAAEAVVKQLCELFAPEARSS